MKFSPIITIGRQYGSGGREVAKKLAEIMNVSFYDKELLAEASKDSGICQEVMETFDEKQGKRGFFSMMGNLQGRMDPAGDADGSHALSLLGEPRQGLGKYLCPYVLSGEHDQDLRGISDHPAGDFLVPAQKVDRRGHRQRDQGQEL